MKRLCLLAAALFAIAPRVAHADAAQDVKDIRAGKLPVRADWLGWGWYNRAAVESRTGDLTNARSSLAAAVAIDPSFAERAAKDHDFDALNAAGR